ncbi:MAG: tetratricopeptide repeat protein [Myxococcota bacterium]|nr:tetratricopeptide repeat protein [Myxococcota bacterium]
MPSVPASLRAQVTCLVSCLVTCLVLAGCGGRTPAARSPAPTVRSEIEQAEVAERARRHDVARVHYERAIVSARDPASIAFARRAYAETLASWGEVAAAIMHLDVAVAAVPRDPGAWHDLGILRHKQGDLGGAITALEHARTLAPADYRPRVALAALRWKQGDRAGAAAEYHGLLELELPDRLRAKVRWALDELAKP